MMVLYHPPTQQQNGKALVQVSQVLPDVVLLLLLLKLFGGRKNACHSVTRSGLGHTWSAPATRYWQKAAAHEPTFFLSPILLCTVQCVSLYITHAHLHKELSSRVQQASGRPLAPGPTA